MRANGPIVAAAPGEGAAVRDTALGRGKAPGRKAFYACLVIAALALLSGLAFADEDSYRFPEIKPGLTLKGGYSFVGLSGSSRAGEYEYLHDSVVGAGELAAFPFPHRIHLDLEYLNGKDNFGDLSYAYRDMVLSRVITRSLFHNLDNFRLVDLDPSNPPPFPDPAEGLDWIASPRVRVQDAAERYGIRDSITSYFLRLKTPNYPLHLYLDGQYVDKDGDVQQRFLGGSGFFNDLERVSRRKDVHWRSSDITVGANSHLGPVEVDLSHSEKRFRAGGPDDVQVDAFGQADYGPGTVVRQAGDYPHNLLPDLEGSTNRLKLHTSYTGKIVASATLSDTDRRNNLSGAKAGEFLGAAEVTWMPLTRVTFVLRYRHRERDADTPSGLADGYYGLSTNPTPLADIRPSISYRTDRLTGDLRYRAFKGVTFYLGYSFKDISRDNTEDWLVPADTRENAVTLKARARLLRGLGLTASFRHLEVENPAYNASPDRGNYAAASLSWTPVARLTAFLSYHMDREERDSAFLSTSASGRDAHRDRIRGSVTFAASEDLSLTASYAYFHDRISQGLEYGNLLDPDNPFIDAGVPYRDTARNYMLGVACRPLKALSLNADVSHTRSRGSFSPGLDVALDPVSVASFTDLRLRETVYDLSAEYALRGGWGVGVRYRYSDFDNLLENPENPDLFDGTAQLAMLTLSKKW